MKLDQCAHRSGQIATWTKGNTFPKLPAVFSAHLGMLLVFINWFTGEQVCGIRLVADGLVDNGLSELQLPQLIIFSFQGPTPSYITVRQAHSWIKSKCEPPLAVFMDLRRVQVSAYIEHGRSRSASYISQHLVVTCVENPMHSVSCTNSDKPRTLLAFLGGPYRTRYYLANVTLHGVMVVQH